MVYFIADECKSYQVLDQADRSMSFADSNVVKCDKNEAEGFRFPGWYRFMGDSGDQMPDKCVPTGRCGTRAPGWLNGQHPTEQEGVVTREVCYHWNKECCKWKNDIKIRNCGEFYVYELQKPPTCDLRYCGNQQGESLLLLTITFTVIQDGKRTNLLTYQPSLGRVQLLGVQHEKRRAKKVERSLVRGANERTLAFPRCTSPLCFRASFFALHLN